VAKGKLSKDARTQIAISGEENLRSTSVHVEDGYLERERRENLEYKGFDVEDFGFERREITFSPVVASHYKANRDMTEHESARVDYDPLDEQNVDRNAMKEEVMEERAEVVRESTKLDFINSAEMELNKAKIEVLHGQKYSPENDFQREWSKIRVTNNDLEEMRTFILSSKEPLKLNFTPKAGGQVVEVNKGSLKIERSEDRKKITITINGAKRTYEVKYTQVWIAEQVEIVKEVENDPWAKL